MRMLLLSLACLLVLSAPLLHAQPAPDTPPVVRSIDLKYTTAKDMLTLLGWDGKQSELKQFIPAGIEKIIGLVGMNMLLVKAKSDEDIDQFAALIKLLDQPVALVQFQISLLYMDYAALQGNKLFTQDITATLNRLPPIEVKNGGSRTDSMPDNPTGVKKLSFTNCIIHPDQTVSITVNDDLPNGLPPTTVRLKLGEMTLLGTIPVPAPQASDTPKGWMLVFITAKSIDQNDKPLAEQEKFGGPPLF